MFWIYLIDIYEIWKINRNLSYIMFLIIINILKNTIYINCYSKNKNV